MKNFKTMLVFVLTILSIGLLSSCFGGDDYVVPENATVNENYVDYSSTGVENISGTKVLFFHADWCPACKAIEKRLTYSDLPENITVFEVNYDESDELKKKYGVTTQTTFVQIDDNGEMIKKWVGAKTVADIVSKVEVVEMKKEETMIKKDEMIKENKVKTEETIMDDKKVMVKEEAMEKNEEMMKKGVYTEYSAEAVENASGDIVLFFHADWCPTCVAFDKKVSSETIPANLTLFKVNYDISSDLRTKYSVLTQTTFVQVDNEGNMIKKWVGARGIESIVDKIK